MTPPSIFVSREHELAQLNAHLEQALLGKGQICFITGEPGQGKTSLALEFARRAQETHPDLATAAGLCDPQTGQGDAYLPFRSILQTLTDTRATQTNEQTPRWQRLVLASTEALLDWGPDLVGTLVPGMAVVAKIGQAVGRQSRLAEKVGKWMNKGKPEAVVATPVDQNQIFQQYVNVITRLSAQVPLVLVLDDLQWADSSSIDLLFHLVRRMHDSRILLIATYRETELELGRHGERHPLTKVVVEVKRYLGDVTIDLAQSQGRAFVDAYLDSEPNHLDEQFRAALFRHTGGNALFVVELLRAMQERGDLVQNGAGQWQVGARLDWNDLPDRAEAVIEERVNRLPDDLRQMLQTASVQGESFAGEVVAQVQDAEVRPVVQRLNSELVRRHRLLLDQGQERVGMTRLSRFAFQNQLFQHYLYHSLNQAERSYLHEDSAKVLEALYGDEVGVVAVQLAWHYQAAGLVGQARTYLRLAGKQATASAAHALAASYFSQALALTSETEQALRFELLLAREEAYFRDGQREAQRADLVALEGLAASLGGALPTIDAALRRARYLVRITADYAQAAVVMQQVLGHAEQAGDTARQAAARRWWAEALLRQGAYAAARVHLERAIELAHEAGDVQIEADALRQLGFTHLYGGDPDRARSLYQAALELCRRMGDAYGENFNLNNLGFQAMSQGLYEQARHYCEEALQVARRAGLREAEAYPLGNIANIACFLGDYSESERYAAQQLQLSRELELRAHEAVARANLGTAHLYLDQAAAGLEELRAALRTFQELGDWEGEALTLLELGEGLRRQGQAEDAAAIYQELLDKAQAQAHPGVQLFALAGLARTALDRAVPDHAGEHALALLALLPRQHIRHDLVAVAHLYLAGYCGLSAIADERAVAVLQVGHQHLMRLAARIESEALRQSFLENVPANRELAAAYAQLVPAGVSDAAVDLAVLFPTASAEPDTTEATPGAGDVLAEVVEPVRSEPMLPASSTAAALPTPQPTHPSTTPATATSALAPIPTAGTIPVQVDLRGAGLAGALLNARNLAGWRLAGADLSRAQLRASDLQNADLRGANLQGADLRGADLRGANMRGADLSGVLTDEQTMWPEDPVPLQPSQST